MAEYYDHPITTSTDWGGDASTDNKPVTGRRVQEFIKNELASKATKDLATTENDGLMSKEDKEKVNDLDVITINLKLNVNSLPKGFILKKGMRIVEMSNPNEVFGAEKASGFGLIRFNPPCTIYEDITSLIPYVYRDGHIVIGKSYNDNISEINNEISEILLANTPKRFTTTKTAYTVNVLPFPLKKGMELVDFDISELNSIGKGIVRGLTLDGQYVYIYGVGNANKKYIVTETLVGVDTTERASISFTIKKIDTPKINTSNYIALPKPQLAKVDITTTQLPVTKESNIQAQMAFSDMQGNYIVKNIIMNAQGNSSLGLPKKNFSIDIVDDTYNESHEIKFGDWVAQDGFHLKSYMLDGIRIKAMASYDVYESILLTRGATKNRAWKRMQLPTNIPTNSNSITDSYLQIDDGAKNHPSGFPVVLYVNESFYGIYCWQLKKHRKNYHQKKKEATHIHLDGNISDTLLWRANGAIDWNKWAGKIAESDAIANYDGIEIRNPKSLILVDGTEYDGDSNRGELISTSSTNYDANNGDMVRTASVRASIESLSSRVYALTQMTKGAEKKSAIAEVFDVDSIIDYIIFGQIIGNVDGYKKNWQWVTYDGAKWAVNAYDLDGVWGWTSWGYFEPYKTWLGNTPPISLVIENYLDEIKERYAELRREGVIELNAIMKPLVNYVKVIGIEFYDQEYKKWTDGARDNLWRFESWMKESIRLTDILMEYTK